MADLIPELYVLWHPKYAVGEALAREIYKWLRPRNGLGPKVYYRSEPAPKRTRGVLPLALPGETHQPVPKAAGAAEATMHIALLLVDEHMIADPAWRHWIEALQLAAEGGPNRCPRLVVPVALDATAFNVPAALRALNYVRPAGIPLPPRESPGYAAAVETVKRSLLKQITELLCRVMLAPTPTPAPGSDPATQPKITVFLSHAKADGTVPARRIRDYIYSQTQLAAFYDENDIPYTAAFDRVLDANIAGTAAMIAVRSAHYAARPWCRREVSVFRKPREEPPQSASQRWRVNPLLVVDALDGGASTAGIPEFGNAPIVRWSASIPDQAEQIVTTLMRDVFLGAFHSAIGRKLADGRAAILVNALPDPTTLAQIPAVRAGGALTVYHPGHQLPGMEVAALRALFPNVMLQSFDGLPA